MFRQSTALDKSRGLTEGSPSEKEASPDTTADVLQGGKMHQLFFDLFVLFLQHSFQMKEV